MSIDFENLMKISLVHTQTFGSIYQFFSNFYKGTWINHVTSAVIVPIGIVIFQSFGMPACQMKVFGQFCPKIDSHDGGAYRNLSVLEGSKNSSRQLVN